MSILTDIKPYILPDFRGVILPTFTVPADLKAAAGAAADCSNAEFLKQLCRVGFVAKLDQERGVFNFRKVLMIEPRHFSALAGLGRILLLYDKDEAALHAFEAALAINPYLDSVRDQVDRLRDRLSGQPI